MSPVKSDLGSARISSQLHVVGVRTRASTVKDQDSVSRRGVGSAVSTGQLWPASYWPGGRRGSRSSPPRLLKPLVNVATMSPELVTPATREMQLPPRRPVV